MGQGRDNLLGVMHMLGAAASFAAFSAMVKLIADGVPLFEIVFFRGAVTFVLLVVWERLRFGGLACGVNRRGLTFRALLGMAGLIMYVYALNHVQLGLASALNQSSPVFVAIFAFMILGERPHPAIAGLVLAAFAGAMLIVSPDFRALDVHALVGLGSAVVSGLAYVWVRKLRTTDKPEAIVRWFSGITALLAIPIVTVQGWVAPSLVDGLLLFGVGAASLTGQLCLTYSYRLGEAAVVSPFLYASVLINLLVGWGFWSEWPTAGALAGAGLLVGSSVAIAVLGGRTANGRAPVVPQ